MKRKELALFALIILIATAAMPSIGVAASQETFVYAEYAPRARFSVIGTCISSLELQSSGLLVCRAETSVTPGNTAGVTIELQQSVNGVWTTIKTWSASKATRISLTETWSVAKGTYRLQCTHTAKNSSGTLLDSFVMQSNTVTYK